MLFIESWHLSKVSRWLANAVYACKQAAGALQWLMEEDVKEDPPPGQRQSIRHTQLRFMSVSRAHGFYDIATALRLAQSTSNFFMLSLSRTSIQLESPELEPWP